MARSNGGCILEVGAVVESFRVTVVELVVGPGVKLQFAPLGRPVQLKVSGRAVLLLEPFAIRNEGVLVLPTAILIGAVVWPCATLTVPPDRFVLNEKFMVVAVTCKLALVGLDVSPEVPMTVIDAVPPAMLGGV